MSFLKIICIRVLMIFLGLTFAMLILEIGLYAIGYTYPILYVADDLRGWSLRPGISGKGTQDGPRAFLEINSSGFRDHERIKIKPLDTLRVAVIGDSFAEAQQVSVDETFWSVMESGLKRCSTLPDKQVEVLNFGVSGYGTGQELITLRHFVWEYSPDVIVLAFYPKNDYIDNYPVGAKTRPYFFMRDGQLVLDNSFRDSADYQFRQSKLGKTAYFLVNHSRFLQLFKHQGILTSMRSIGNKAIGMVDFSSPSTPASADLVDQHVEGRPGDFAQQEGIADDNVNSAGKVGALEPTIEKVVEVGTGDFTQQEGITDDNVDSVSTAWTTEPRVENPIQIKGKAGIITDFDRDKAQAITEKLISTINKEVLDRNARFVVMEVTVNYKARDRIYYSELEGLSEKHGIPLINLTSYFLSLGPEYDYHLSGHWDSDGHYIAGEHSAEFICDNLFN